MPRGPTVYSLPPGTTPQAPGDTIASATFNAAMDDIANTFNTPQPVVYGGTGGVSASDARTNLGLEIGVDIPSMEDVNPPTLAKTANYTVLSADLGKTILCDATSAAFTVTLLAAATAGDGFTVTVKKTDSSVNIVTIDGDGSETIDGSTTYLLRPDDESVTLICNGTAWFVKGTAPARQAVPRAWVRYNGSSNSIASSFGVSSVTRSAAGSYTVNFTNAFADTNYAVIGTTFDTASSAITTISGNATISVGSFAFIVRNAGGTNVDVNCVNLVFYA